MGDPNSASPSNFTVPASTLTPEPSSSAAPRGKSDIQIEVAPEALADDESQVALLTGIVNAVYKETEGDIFVESYKRINSEELRHIIRAGELGVAYLNQTPGAPFTKGPAVGCIRMQKLSDTLGEFGMLALDATHRGGGAGREMALFAERHLSSLGLKDMQLELLFPSEYEHPFKIRLQTWYSRMGYKVVKLGVFVDDYPQLAPLLRVPCEYRVFQKSLT